MNDSRGTIFFAGLFPGKNQVLLEELCKRFRVITLKGFYFESGQWKPELAEEIIPEEELIIQEVEIVFLMNELLTFLDRDLKRLAPEFSESPISLNELHSFYPMCKVAISMAFVFKKLIEYVKIDLVISNADYSGMRRPITIEAKKLGIPTLNIEHGYFAMSPGAGALIAPEKHSAWFDASDFINLDNELEKKYWEQFNEHC